LSAYDKNSASKHTAGDKDKTHPWFTHGRSLLEFREISPEPKNQGWKSLLASNIWNGAEITTV
jgi:hypothetical protein